MAISHRNYQPKATFTAKDIKDAITVIKTFPKALKETLAACDANDLSNPTVQEDGPFSNWCIILPIHICIRICAVNMLS